MKNKKAIQRSKTISTLPSKTPTIDCPYPKSINTAIINRQNTNKIDTKKKAGETAKAKLLKSSFSLKIVNNSSNKPKDRSNEFSLTQSLSLISEIQQLFESSVNENKKPIEDIKQLLRTSLSLEEYIPLSAKEKQIIEYDITKTSDLRIENYQLAFSHIFTSLENIKKTLNRIVDDNYHYLVCKEKSKAKKVYINEGHNIVYDDEEEDETDFSEKTMTEKTQMLPLNSSIIINDDQRLLKNKSICFVMNTVTSLPEKETVASSPLSNLGSTESKFKPYSSFEYLDTFSDSLVVLGKSKLLKKEEEECIIY